MNIHEVNWWYLNIQLKENVDIEKQILIFQNNSPMGKDKAQSKVQSNGHFNIVS